MPSENAKTGLAGYVAAFERVNGRTPTEEENREALALVEVVRASEIDPFLVYYLVNKRAQDALERVPSEIRAVMDEATTRIKQFVGHAMSEKEREALVAQLDRIEASIDRNALSLAIPKLRSFVQRRPHHSTSAPARTVSVAETTHRDELAAQLKRIAEASVRQARPEVALAYGTNRRTLVAFVVAAVTVALASLVVSEYSRHAVLTLVVTLAFIAGVAANTVFYEARN